MNRVPTRRGGRSANDIPDCFDNYLYVVVSFCFGKCPNTAGYIYYSHHSKSTGIIRFKSDLKVLLKRRFLPVKELYT
jgi:hypothetical protein